jgi:hypothetical protein
MAEPKVSIIIAAKDLASRVFNESKARISAWGKSVGGALTSVRGLAAAAGVALGASALFNVFRRATQEAIESEAANARMAQSIANLGLSYDALKPKIDDTVDRLSKLAGKDDEEVSDALSNLITKTGDLTGSLEMLPTVLDVAAKQKISLASASDIVAKAMNGQTRALRELGITTKDHDKAMQQLRERYAGFAAREGQNVQGLLARIRLGWANMLETLGEVIFSQDGVRGALQRVEERLEAGRAWIIAHREEVGRWVSAAANMASWLLDLTAFIVRITLRVIEWLDAHRGLTRFMAASAGTATLFFAPFALAGAVTIPGLIAALGRLRLALIAMATNPIILAITAVSVAVGYIAMEAARAQQAIEDLKTELAGLSGAQLKVREAETRAKLSRAEAQAAALPTSGGLEDKATAARRNALEQEIADFKRELVEIDRERTRRFAQAFTEFGASETAKRTAETKKTPPPTGEEEDGKAARERDKAERERLQLLKDRAAIDQMRVQALAELAHWEGELTTRLQAGNLQQAEEVRLRKLLADVQGAQADAQEREIETLQKAVAQKVVTLDVVTRLYTAERQLIDAIAAEDRALAAGEGSLARRVELEERLAKVRSTLGKPPQIGKGTGADIDRPAPATRIETRVPTEQPREGPGFGAQLGVALQQYSDNILGTAEDGTKQIESLGDALAAVTAGSLVEFQDAWIQTFEMIGAGTMTLGQGLAGMVGQFVSSLARGLAKLYFAKGVGAIGDAIFGYGPGYAAAAKFFAASGLFAALAGATGGAQTGGGGGGGGGDSGRGGGVAGAPERGAITDPLTVVMPKGVSVFDSSNPRIVEAWAKMLGDLTGRRIIVRVDG